MKGPDPSGAVHKLATLALPAVGNTGPFSSYPLFSPWHRFPIRGRISPTSTKTIRRGLGTARAEPNGISWLGTDASTVKGMLIRGDRQRDVAAWFVESRPCR